MWEETYVCGKWLKHLRKTIKYVGNDVDLWEIAKIFGNWLKYLTNGSINWEMTERFGKCLKYLRNGLDIWGTT